MRISTKGRYALRLMLDLAMNGGEGYISLKAVAKRQEISDKYLEQIIHRLSREGLVESARGAQGGYRLARPAAAYSVGEILRTVGSYCLRMPRSTFLMCSFFSFSLSIVWR